MDNGTIPPLSGDNSERSSIPSSSKASKGDVLVAGPFQLNLFRISKTLKVFVFLPLDEVSRMGCGDFIPKRWEK